MQPAPAATREFRVYSSASSDRLRELVRSAPASPWPNTNANSSTVGWCGGCATWRCGPSPSTSTALGAATAELEEFYQRDHDQSDGLLPRTASLRVPRRHAFLPALREAQRPTRRYESGRPAAPPAKSRTPSQWWSAKPYSDLAVGTCASWRRTSTRTGLAHAQPAVQRERFEKMPDTVASAGSSRCDRGRAHCRARAEALITFRPTQLNTPVADARARRRHLLPKRRSSTSTRRRNASIVGQMADCRTRRDHLILGHSESLLNVTRPLWPADRPNDPQEGPMSTRAPRHERRRHHPHA